MIQNGKVTVYNLCPQDRQISEYTDWWRYKCIWVANKSYDEKLLHAGELSNAKWLLRSLEDTTDQGRVIFWRRVPLFTSVTKMVMFSLDDLQCCCTVAGCKASTSHSPELFSFRIFLFFQLKETPIRSYLSFLELSKVTICYSYSPLVVFQYC